MKKNAISLAMALMLSLGAFAQGTAESRLSQLTTHEKIGVIHAQSKFTSAGVARLGIPQLNMDDGPHGVREELGWNSWSPAYQTNDSVVAFPSLTCLAATWNRDLSRLYGDKVSEEFAYRGKNVLLGPGVSIARTPLCGRNFEYMGEDPYLAGEMVVPYIQAAQQNGIACCLKHFFLNNEEPWRMGLNVEVSERAVEEIYLPAFEKACKVGHVWSIMPSYNKWLGHFNCENDSLLNGILKKRWGWDGATISDWGAVHFTDGAVYGGIDLEMGTDTNGKTEDRSKGFDAYRLANAFEKGIYEGKYPMSILDDKARRVLRLIDRTALSKNRIIGKMCSEDHYAACQQIGEEGITLLKNSPLQKGGEGILPLTAEKLKGKRILIVGENATRNLCYGGGSSELKTKKDICPEEGLAEYFHSIGIEKVSADSPREGWEDAQGYYAGRSLYAHVDKLNPAKQDSLRQDALQKAKDADIIIYIGGMNKNYQQDCEGGDRLDYNLSFGQNELISELAKIQKNIIVCIYGGNAYATPWINDVSALVHCWYLGNMSGKALASVLSGKVNPSGKLPVTFAKQLSDYPYTKYGEESYPGVVTDEAAAKAHPEWEGEGKTIYYKEGINVGYRGFVGTKTKPQFPFGFGLSYTTFSYGKATVTPNTPLGPKGRLPEQEHPTPNTYHPTPNTYTLTVPVTNTGKVAGKEVVELYVGQKNAKIARPARELKGFEKLSLAPGETKTATFTVSTDDLRYFNETTHQWTLAPGTYNLMVGASSEDIRSTVSINVK